MHGAKTSRMLQLYIWEHEIDAVTNVTAMQGDPHRYSLLIFFVMFKVSLGLPVPNSTNHPEDESKAFPLSILFHTSLSLRSKE